MIKGDVIEDDEGDGVRAVSEGSSQVLQYEYHILYSCSYRAPVLYFRAFTLGKWHVCESLQTHTYKDVNCCADFVSRWGHNGLNTTSW